MFAHRDEAKLRQAAELDPARQQVGDHRQRTAELQQLQLGGTQRFASGCRAPLFDRDFKVEPTRIGK